MILKTHVKRLEKLSKAKDIIIDDNCYHLLKNYTWYLNSYGYAVAYKEKNAILMHRLLTNCPKNLVVDHINGNRLDNRLDNLRVCTKAENNRNTIITRKKIGVATCQQI